ncbi:MAG TPA: CPBP family intramembrane glutamic endopeptidase [Actinomadura sp.]|nr:CPBP family intramembrane glutamic endopeptidase [Actinomadura sp.]
MKTPDRPGEGWALPDPGLTPSPDVPPPSADSPSHPAMPPPAPAVRPYEGYEGYEAAPSYGPPPRNHPPSPHGHPAGPYIPYDPYGPNPSFQGQGTDGFPGWPVPYGHAAGPVPPRPARAPWAVPAGPGTPFHRLARTPLHRWWRPLAGTLFAVALGLVAMVAVMLLSMVIAMLLGEDPLANAKSDQIFTSPIVDLGMQLVSLGVLTPIVLLAAWLLQRRPAGSLSSVEGRLRGRWLIACAGLAVAACLLSYVASWGAFSVTGAEDTGQAGWAGWTAFLPTAAMILLLVPFQAAAEEYVFRGWLLQAIASCTFETRTGRVGRTASVLFRTPWPAIVISALLFAAGHAYKGWALLDVFLFGIAAGWLAVRTGGLEASITLHVVNNLGAFMVPAATGELGNALRVTEVPWQAIVGTIVQLVAFAVLVLLSARRRRLRRVSEGASPRPGPVEARAPLPVAGPIPGAL